MDWIDSEKELPSCDGIYEVTNQPSAGIRVIGIATYDGYGFMYDGVYRNPRFWREPTYNKEKRYGKIA